MAKTVMATALVVALLTTIVQAQLGGGGGGMGGSGGTGGMGGGGGGGGRHQQQQDKKDKRGGTPKADEKAYNDALKAIPNKKPSDDAWRDMR